MRGVEDDNSSMPLKNCINIVIDILGQLLYNKNETCHNTVGGQSKLPKGGMIIMNNYVTWGELIQVGIFLTGYTSLVVYITIKIIKRK